MSVDSYIQRRGQLETYFDRTAAEAWARLTSTAKVSRIRETVRMGRDRMRDTLLAGLPMDMRGTRLLDAGCGTGALSVEAALRGANVVAIDLSATLVKLAEERLPKALGAGSIEFHVGDMLDASLGHFDYVVSMDSLIHYDANDIVDALEALTARTRVSVQFTFAPKTPLLTVMHNVGKLFPRGDRAPAIVPVSESNLRRLIPQRASMAQWKIGRSARIKSGFYTSHAMELVRQ
jgi:magnesium-protoporphyrin O-methyltransferase